MNSSTQVLIFSIISNLVIIIIAYNIFKNKLSQQEKTLKKHFNSILGLSISHLHDAANFFALIKQNINEESSREAANFAKGAAFHFRSIFDELKTSFDSFNQMGVQDLNKAKLDLLYQKSSIDLKDLLEMELFQISNFSRVEIINNSNSEHALSLGNFSLLSKAVLNLVENALKHTEGRVRLELKENGKKWQIKISSFGKSVPEEIANNINNSKNVKTGHGLSSLIDILDFHNSKAEIITLAEEGSSIIFELEKYSALKYEEVKTQAFNSSPLIFISLSIVLMLLSSWLIVQHNRNACHDYFKSKTKILKKHEIPIHLENRIEYAKTSLLRLKELAEHDDLSETQSTIEEINNIKNEILENTSSTERMFVSYLLFRYIDIHLQPNLKGYIEEEASKQIVYYPNSLVLNHYKADSYSRRGIYYKSMFYTYKELTSLFQEKLYLNPELYSAEKIINRFSDLNSFSLIIGSALKKAAITPDEELAIEQAAQAEIDLMTTVNGEVSSETEAKAKEFAQTDDKKLLEDLENNEEINQYRVPSDFNKRMDRVKEPAKPSPSPSTTDLDALINKQDTKLELRYEL